jgi:hypothetical protein
MRVLQKEKKSNVGFENLMCVLHSKKKNPMWVLRTLCMYCIWRRKIQCGFCDPYGDIAFEKEKFNMGLQPFLWVLWNEQSILDLMDPHASTIVQRPSIHCDLSTGIAKKMLNPMSNKHKECGYYNFLIGGLICLWKYCGVVFLHMCNFNW